MSGVAHALPVPQPRHKISASEIARYAAPLALVIIVIVFAGITPTFFTVGNLTALLVSAAILLVVSLGQQMVVAVGGIDLSVGASLPWAGVVLGFGIHHRWGDALSIIACLLAGVLVGIINGLLVAVLRMTDFIVTLGSLSVVSGVTLLITGGNITSVNTPLLQSLALDGIGPVRWFWLVGIVLAAVAAWILFRTKSGVYLLSTGGNIDAARSVGIPVRAVRVSAYVGSGLACGIAAVLFVAMNGGSDPTLQTNLLLSSIAAVVLGGASLAGGRASVVGTVAGALLLQTLLNGFTLLNISQYFQPIAVGIVVLGAALISRFQK